MTRLARLLEYWILVLALSITITLPVVLLATALGSDRDFDGLTALLDYSLGAILLVWPLGFWVAFRLMHAAVSRKSHAASEG